MISFSGDTMSVRFDTFGLESYSLFLRTKKLPEQRIAFDVRTGAYTVTAPARFAPLLGVQAPKGGKEPLPLPKFLHPHQRALAPVALQAKRYAFWWDCGLGKTLAFLEYARQVAHLTGGRVLILSPLSIINQTCEEAEHFYGGALTVQRIWTRADLELWCKGAGEQESPIGISNYEKLIAGELPEFRHLAGLVLDESSILKSGGGVIKWNLIKSARGIEYKLSCTATPAPNDTMEYASQAAFLEKLRTEGEILWTFFRRNAQTQEWEVKPHAREAFYRFMAGWSVYLRNPAAFGWGNPLKGIPEPVYHEHKVPCTAAQRAASYERQSSSRGLLFDSAKMGVVERLKLSQIAKGFIYLDGQRKIQRIDSKKPKVVADLIAMEAAKHQTLVWTVFDEEARIVMERLPAKLRKEAVNVCGKMTDDQRAAALESFRTGKAKVMISKPQLLGYGMNFQHCKAMIFSGWDDSYERFYQALRRAYRYGQRHALQVHIPYIEELEGPILQNVLRKKESFERDTFECERHYRAAMKEIC